MSADLRTLDIAIAHKHYPERGGAERVADELGRTFDAPIYTAYDDGASADDVDVRELFADHWAIKHAEKFGPLEWTVRDAFYALAWEKCDELRDYDVVIQSGAAPWWYVPPDDQVLVRYVHSPPRTPFDLFGAAESQHVKWYSRAVRSLYPQTTSYGDLHVCNSELVARRTQRYLGVNSPAVVYPPVDVSAYSPTEGSGDYYIALSRLAPGKGFEEIIDAFKLMPERELRIVGDGSEREALEDRAQGCANITFEGYVSEDRKVSLLEDARALVFAAHNEDFGMVPIEAFAAGTPVIGVDEGFTRHQVQPGVAGHLFERGAENIRTAVKVFDTEGVAATPAELHVTAQECSVPAFREKMRDLVRQAYSKARVRPKLWGTLSQLESRGHNTVAGRFD